MKRSVMMLGLLALAGCGKPEAEQPTASSLPLNEYMAHVVDPNARQLWRWQGFVANEKGVTDFTPKNAEEWEEAETAGLTQAELTSTLHHAPRRRDDGKDNWDKRVGDLRKAASDAATAAEKQDADGFSNAADAVNVACVECHYAFAPHLEPPRSPE